MRGLLGLLLRTLLRLLPLRFLPWVILLFTRGLTYALQASRLEPARAADRTRQILKLLLIADDTLYKLTSETAIHYEGGIHPKHRLTRYHDFFVKNIEDGERVLDIGCGIGVVAHDIALLSGADDIIGLDMSREQIDFAKSHYEEPNLHFICGKAPEAIPERRFDVVVLSNVLEHIERRVEFLLTVAAKTGAKKFLFRVPLFERDWRVPMKKELGLNYFSDPTHYVEHTFDEFVVEVEAAGLIVNSYEIRWGEIWAVCVVDQV